MKWLPEEPLRLAFAVSGQTGNQTWNGGSMRAADFFYLKGVIQGLFGRLGLPALNFERSAQPSLHPGRQASVLVPAGDGLTREIGFFGELHPAVAADYGVDQRSVLAELDWETIVITALRDVKRYKPLPRFPSIERDLAVVVSHNVTVGKVEEVIRSAGGSLLCEVALFDLYQGHPVPEGKKSLAYRLVYRALDRTLTDSEIEEAFRAVRETLAAKLDADIRS